MSITKQNPTVLRLWGMGVPPYSARGIQQTLEPIDAQAHIERTINGGLIDLGNEELRKYKSTISGSDQRPPAVDGAWPGKVLTVECAAFLCCSDYNIAGRDPVDGSVFSEAGFTFYRPVLNMMVFAFSTEEDEYGRSVSWKMDLEEI